MRCEYRDFLNNLATKLFNDSFDYERDGNRFYQLSRNYLLGAALSQRWNIGFRLVAIVNDLNRNIKGRSHREEFDNFCSLLTEKSNMNLVTWQQIWKSLPSTEDMLPLLNYLTNHPLLSVK